MTRALLAACAVFVASVSAAEDKVTSRPKAEPGAALRAVASYAAPAGWKAADHANEGGADAVLEFRKGLDRITLRLFGAKGSAYKNPDAFLRGPAATTMGKAPEAVGVAVVAGEKRAVYRHGYPIMLGDPHAASSGRPDMAREHFVVVPLRDGRFLVAAHAFESPIPSYEKDGEKAYEAFLKTLRPLPVKKASK